MATYTCSLSGLPATKAVVTPSGHICSLSLLLTKLSENGGIDPFDPDAKRSLDESDLIHLADNTNASSQILPPRPPSTTSLPSILTILQQEFDAVLLELYDTRKALEETRRELSTALYQNDAAVRVIARVCAERDELKNSRYQHQDQMQGQQQGEKRTRDEKDEEEVQPSKKKKGDGIPLEDMQAMTTTWTQLNAARKPIAKLKRSPEEIASIEDKLKSLGEKKVNVHKSNSNGVLGLQCVVNTQKENKEQYVVSIGKDGQIVVYNVSTGVIAHTVSCAGVERAHAVSTSEDGILICASTVNKEVKLYVLQEEEVKLVSSMEVDSEIVGIAIHPSSTLDAVRIVVATASDILLVKSSSSGGEMEVLTKLEDSAGHNVKYTAGELHPDGFIYAHGTEGGKLVIWDLKTQSLAMTLDISEGNPITSVTFSENGYHLAISTPSAVFIFDLRKQKCIGTINEKVYALSFDPTASYLAYGTEGSIKICVAKDWDKVVATLDYEKKNGGKGKKKDENVVKGGLVWGSGAGEEKVWLASGCDREKPVRFWGVE